MIPTLLLQIRFLNFPINQLVGFYHNDLFYSLLVNLIPFFLFLLIVSGLDLLLTDIMNL